jgi:hypothetical protein
MLDEKMKERDHMEELDVHGRILWRRMFRQQGERCGRDSRNSERDSWLQCSIKGGEFPD